MKKSVINALQYKQQSSGIGVNIRELFGRYVLIADCPSVVVLSKDSPDFPAGQDTVLVRSPYNYSESIPRMLYQSFFLGLKYCKNAVLLTTDSKIPLLLPRSCRVIPLITDLAVFRMSEVYQFSRVLLWKFQYRYLRRRADRILTVSEFTKSDVINILGIPANRITVIPCACAENYCRVEDEAELDALRKKYALPERYVLFVGNSNPRKNLERMMKSFDRASELLSEPYELIIAGEQGWKFDREAALRDIAHPERIRFLGFLPDEDMPALYSAASLFAFPTLYEGFGIPVLEAQQCGTPVLTSNVTSLPEVGGSSVVYADPYDIESIKNGICAVLGDPEKAAELVRLGYENAARFSWQNSAEKLIEFLRGEA